MAEHKTHRSGHCPVVSDACQQSYSLCLSLFLRPVLLASHTSIPFGLLCLLSAHVAVFCLHMLLSNNYLSPLLSLETAPSLSCTEESHPFFLVSAAFFLLLFFSLNVFFVSDPCCFLLKVGNIPHSFVHSTKSTNIDLLRRPPVLFDLFRRQQNYRVNSNAPQHLRPNPVFLHKTCHGKLIPSA